MRVSVTPRFAAAAGLAAAVLIPPMASQAATPDGKTLFKSDCASCHKADGEGGVKLGKAVSADLRSPGLEDMYKHDDNLLLRAILQGKDEDGESLDAPMPHWKGTLTKDQAVAIIAYLKTLCCSKAPDADE